MTLDAATAAALDGLAVRVRAAQLDAVRPLVRAVVEASDVVEATALALYGRSDGPALLSAAGVLWGSSTPAVLEHRGEPDTSGARVVGFGQ